MEKHFFRDILIGNNYKIRNLYINSKRTVPTGFFGDVNNGATISNLSITGNLIYEKDTSNSQIIGGIVGRTSGNGIKTIINCNNYCNITTYGYAGGIIGKGEGVQVIQCANFGKIKTLGRRICICRRYKWNPGGR